LYIKFKIQHSKYEIIKAQRVDSIINCQGKSFKSVHTLYLLHRIAYLTFALHLCNLRCPI